LEISPVGRIQAQCGQKVRRKKKEYSVKVSKEERIRGSAAESGLHHMDDGVLLGDNLSLLNQGDNHEAHGKDAESER
jgi:hypothetical protein